MVKRSLKVASYNVRYDPKAQPLYVQAAKKMFVKSEGLEKSWCERRLWLTDQVKWESPDIIGFQEPLHPQVEDLSSLLGAEYDWRGVGRNDGKKAGEYVPIFWRRDRFELVGEPEYFWLSPTPHIPGSKGWDAQLTRMCNLIRLRDLLSPSSPPIVVMNTHFDHLGIVARYESGKMIREKIAAQGDTLVLFVGDLNSVEEEEGYRVLTGNKYVGSLKGHPKEVKDVEGLKFIDARHEVPLSPDGGENMSRPLGDQHTFTGFGIEKDAEWKVIDFVMIADNGVVSAKPPPSSTPQRDAERKEQKEKPKWGVKRFGIVDSLVSEEGEGKGKKTKSQWRISDHRMVVAVLEIEE
ncbi:hypothetical protein BT69DRAFT_1259912 [Atractiella rhizophila]|nr:hypothetical protein BT69DRAFT_1259912 [Atractiella rhizophila]